MADSEEAEDAINDAVVEVIALLGATTMTVSQILKLGRGAVIELDARVGDEARLLVRDNLIARGEVMVVDDKIGLTITEMVKKTF
ncbi:flagellar motor switch protein FliN [Alphaproteobacteria bacterium HT1-32]|nr:flagellar motor switch protein FliN [Alphaproteobacteria bacterium HT1-32]|tara:strand:- start:9710 stop:9964 length:255 start_codon:yes stop_codon:yes gene_type:complete